MARLTPHANNYVLIILDSCRYDSFIEARPRVMPRLGDVEQRWSYASWTAPSHYNLLSGLLPHNSPKQVFASDYYKRDFLKFSERLGLEGITFKSLIPTLYFPVFLKETLGYRTHAMVSLPVLNPRTVLNHGFDTYRLMDKHNDMRAMLRQMTFDDDRPSFYLLNVGETHYPYALPHEDPKDWPRISGVHGIASITCALMMNSTAACPSSVRPNSDRQVSRAGAALERRVLSSALAVSSTSCQEMRDTVAPLLSGRLLRLVSRKLSRGGVPSSFDSSIETSTSAGSVWNTYRPASIRIPDGVSRNS